MSVKITGLDPIIKRLKKLENMGIPLKPVLNNIGNDILSNIETNFSSQSGPKGAWKPLKRATVMRKIRKRKRTAILQESGILADFWAVNATDKKVCVSNNKAKTKNAFPYGVVHQYGSKNVPARPFLPLDNNGLLEQKLLKKIKKKLGDFILSKI